MKFTGFGFIGAQTLFVEYLIVGGGAAGEASNPTIRYSGYGGGGGGFYSSSAEIQFSSVYPIVVGEGGTGETLNGGSSSFNGFYAGGGDGYNSGYPQLNGTSNDVTCSFVPLRYYKGGGGGASETGSAAVCLGGEDAQGGYGGDGLAWLDGKYYSGGGGGGTYINNADYVGIGGIGGGGNGEYGAVAPQTGSQSTGGGGGGAGFGGVGGDGGSGVVVIRYAGNPQMQGGIITSSGSYTYHTFLTSSVLYT